MIQTPRNTESEHLSDTVMLIHGMCAGNRSMHRIGQALKAVDFQVDYWGYSSLTRSLMIHGRNLADVICEQASGTSIRRMHFVGPTAWDASSYESP